MLKRIYPCSKINLGLNIVAKRPDGYHDLETVFYPIGICDELAVEESSKTSLTVLSGEQGVNTPLADEDAEKNLVMRAYRLMEKECQLPPVKMTLTKHIPLQAGMGGGSSDAAFTLKLLNDLFSAGLSQDELRTMAAQLGADCAFFIDAQPAYAEGIGERLEPLELDLSCYHLMMVKPPVAVSTKEAFSSIHSQRPKKNCRQIVAQPIESWREELVNDFEQSIFRLHPELTDIKAKLYQAGAVYAAMSGSGSSLFGIFEQKPLVEFPGCWTAVLPPEELFPIVDELGNILGCITRKRAHDGTKVLHPVVHLHVFNSQGQLYLQKRPEWKDIQPGKWDTSVGGHVDFGEDVRTALRREVSEELGINDFTPEELGSYMFEGLRERELVYVHKTVYDGKVNPSKEELDDGRFWSPEEITENMGKGIFTPNFEDEYRRFFLKE